MRQQLSIRQYRRIDLFFFSAILCVCEALITLAATRWFPGEPYVLSVTPTVCAVVMFRWGPWAGIPAVLGAAVLCALSRATPGEYVIYVLGNLFCLFLLIPLKRIGWKRIRESSAACVGFGLAAVLLMQTGRAVVSLFFSRDLSVSVLYYTTDVMSVLFTVILMWICRRLDGIMEDQRHYVIRVGREMNSETESENAGRMEQ